MSETAAQGTLAFATWIQVAELEDLTGNATFGAHIQVGFDKGRIVGARAGEAEGLDGLVALVQHEMDGVLHELMG